MDRNGRHSANLLGGNVPSGGYRDDADRQFRFALYGRAPFCVLHASGFDIVLCKGVVRIAVQPEFPRLGRGDHRMATRVGMLRGVAVGRRIAAQCRATRLTGAQMDPWAAGFDALLALMALGAFDGVDRIDMRTRLIGHDSTPFIQKGLYERRRPRSLLLRRLISPA
jgi:hypothetical protein